MASLIPNSTSRSPADLADPLTQLHDIHLPEPVSAWPPAPGWWLLAIVLLVLIAYTTYRVLRKRRRNRYRQLALQELAHIQSRTTLNSATGADTPSTEAAAVKNAAHDQNTQIAAINQLLKRVALLVFPYGATAQMSGSAWAEFLAAQCPAPKAEDFALLSEGPYQDPDHSQPPTAEAITQLIAATRRWIKHHRAPEHASLSKNHCPPQQRGQR